MFAQPPFQSYKNKLVIDNDMLSECCVDGMGHKCMDALDWDNMCPNYYINVGHVMN